MSEGRDGRILRLAIPNILAAISTPLIGIADTAMIGHLPEVAFLGAVAAASVIFDVLFWSTGFLRMGTTALVSQHYGAGDRRACAEALYRSLLVALVLGIAMVLLRDTIAAAGFAMVGGSQDVHDYGTQYFGVRVVGAPLVLTMITLNGFFLGTANAVAPLCVTMVANVVNIGADYVLIFGKLGVPAMGVRGAAWAAVLGNAAAVATGLAILVWRYRDYVGGHTGRLFARSELLRLFRTNAHLFGRTVCLLFAQFSMLAMVARMGEVPLVLGHADGAVFVQWIFAGVRHYLDRALDAVQARVLGGAHRLKRVLADQR